MSLCDLEGCVGEILCNFFSMEGKDPDVLFSREIIRMVKCLREAPEDIQVAHTMLLLINLYNEPTIPGTSLDDLNSIDKQKVLDSLKEEILVRSNP